MDGPALYEKDIYAWSQHQAAVLRRMAANPAALPNDLDLEHVAEEIEEVGNEQRYAVESGLVQVFVHLIKIVALPEDQALRHWTKEANAFLDTAESRYRPSMQRALDAGKLWSRACRLATRDLETDGHPMPPCRRSARSGWMSSWAVTPIRGSWPHGCSRGVEAWARRIGRGAPPGPSGRPGTARRWSQHRNSARPSTWWASAKPRRTSGPSRRGTSRGGWWGWIRALRRRPRRARYGRASSTMLNGVSAATRTRPKPPARATAASRAGPACAPSAAPTSCAMDAGVQIMVDAA